MKKINKHLPFFVGAVILLTVIFFVANKFLLYQGYIENPVRLRECLNLSITYSISATLGRVLGS